MPDGRQRPVDSDPREMVADVVPGMAGNFEALVSTPNELVFRVEASRKWFTADEIYEFERMVQRILEEKRRPKLKAI